MKSRPSLCKSAALPLSYPTMVEAVGIEPTTGTLQKFPATLAVAPVAYNGVEPFSPVYQTDALTPVLIGSW